MKASPSQFHRRSLIVGISVILLILFSHLSFSALCAIAKTAEDMSYKMPVINSTQNNDWGVVPGAAATTTEVTKPAAQANTQVTTKETRAIESTTQATVPTETTMAAAITTSPNDMVQSVSKTYFFDVGEGNSCLYVFSDGKTLLVDSGSFEYSDVVLKDLKDAGVTKLDAVVVTHQHEDHMGCMPEILQTYAVGTLYMPTVPAELLPDTQALTNLAYVFEEQKITPVSPEKGDIILSGSGYSVTVQSDYNNIYNDLNNYSIVLHVIIGSVAVQMEGDSEAPVEANLLTSGQPLQSDILLVGHHGAAAGSSAFFLLAVAPKTSIVSCGVNNTYGDPHDEVLMRLAFTDLYRTDKDGTIVIETDGTTYQVTAQGNGL